MNQSALARKLDVIVELEKLLKKMLDNNVAPSRLTLARGRNQ